MSPPATPLRLAVISGDDAHHRYLVWSLLRERFEVTTWIVEPAAAQRRRALRQRRWRDWLAALYHLRRRQFWGLDRYRQGAFALPGVLPHVHRTEVKFVNGPEAHELLRAARPDATVVIGCGILAPSMLALAGAHVINVHGGYLPDYRGNHCIFFALDNGDYDKIGASLHYVDETVDTGDLLEVITPEVDPIALAEELYCRADRLAIECLLRWLLELQAGRPLPRQPQPERGRTYRTRDRTPYHDVRHWLRRHRRRRLAARAGSDTEPI
jgi:hypothetical protein